MKQSVQMHIGRLHDKSIPTFSGGGGRKAKHHAHGNGNGSLAIATLPRKYRGVKLQVQNRNGHTPRKYTRQVPAATPHSHGTEVKVNFCSNCGNSIESQAQGIVIANLLKTNPRFRSKVEKLLAKE
jgi:hypothetical protein